MKASRITAAVVLTATVLFGAPATADAQGSECEGQEVVNLMDTRIYAHTNGMDSQGNPWQSSMVWDLNPAIPSGTYDVSAMSWDEYEGRSGDSQANESWYVEFLGAGDVLLDSTAETTDVPDGLALGKVTSNVGQVTFNEEVKAVKTIHAGDPNGSADSVLMGCLGLNPAGDTVPDASVEEAPVEEGAAACSDQVGFHDVNGECVAIAAAAEEVPATDTSVPEAVEEAPASCSDQVGFHDVNGECVAIAVEAPAPVPTTAPAAEALCTDKAGYHDVNGECVAISVSAVQTPAAPVVPAECTDKAGYHDRNGTCVPICGDGEKLVAKKCEAAAPVTAKAQVAGKVQAKAPANTAKAIAANTAKKPVVVAAANVNKASEVAANQTLPATGSTTSTALAWAFGILLAGAAMGLSAKAVRGH